MRTGAATAVAAKHLANVDSKVVGILGCGVQGRSNLEALLVVLKGIEEVRAYDIIDANLRRYVDEMKTKHGLRVIGVDSPRKSVEGCDVVVSAGPILKHPKPVIEADWLKDGGFACALDFDSYWKPEAMQGMDKFCTDDKEQLAYYRTQGYFSDIPEVHAELGEIVIGKKAGRENRKERTMSMNLGTATNDIAAATLIHMKARQKSIGKRLAL
jgi:ornithine cyclodeaminase/alanine dehydrogenase